MIKGGITVRDIMSLNCAKKILEVALDIEDNIDVHTAIIRVLEELENIKENDKK